MSTLNFLITSSTLFRLICHIYFIRYQALRRSFLKRKINDNEQCLDEREIRLKLIVQWRKINRNVKNFFQEINDTKAFIQIKKFSSSFLSAKSREIEHANNLRFLLTFSLRHIRRKLHNKKEKTIFCHLYYQNLPRLKRVPKCTTFIIIFFIANRYLFHSYQFSFIWFYIRTHESQSWGNLIFYICDWRHSRQGQKIEKKQIFNDIHKKHVCWFLVKKMFFHSFCGLKAAGKESSTKMLSKNCFTLIMMDERKKALKPQNEDEKICMKKTLWDGPV